MFTGIIQRTGKIILAQPLPASPGQGPATLGATLTVETGYTDLTVGESVAINGVCLTVTEFTPKGDARFFVSRETLERTNLGDLGAGSPVNLERALQAGERLSGHIVQGHVDGKARLRDIRAQGESQLLDVELPAGLGRYCVEKGSITLDGVSLTINSIQSVADQPIAGQPSAGRTAAEDPGTGCLIGITLVPHTWNHTCFSSSKPGHWINVEVDVVAKYVEKLCQPYQKP